MPDTLTILTSVVSSAVVSSGAVFILRNWISEKIKSSIQHEYNEKLETHKAQLKSHSEIATEQLKSQLQIAAAERNIKLTRIFEDQADVIAETYSKLMAVVSAFEEYTAAMEFENTPPKSERRKILGQRMGEFLNYYKPKRIYIPKQTQAKVDEFYKKLHVATMQFMF